MIDAAQKRWVDLWRKLGVENSGALFSELSAHYVEPHRAYHNLTHIAQCLVEFEPVQAVAKDSTAVELAIWYHDVIYDPRSKENEKLSAEFALRALQGAGLPASLSDHVTRLIMATKSHDASLDEDAPVMVDVDLSILGQATDRFDEYERQIRLEYDWVSAEAFATGRAGVLRSFLGRANIYATDSFRSKYEKIARSNLQRSLGELEAGSAKDAPKR